MNAPDPTLAPQLLSWYDAHARALPWRRSDAKPPDPYRVWLSEVMLQQTRVETVIPYFERWLERFPTLEALAGAAGDEVMKAWEGLGYYSRARNLHRAVREVARAHGGRVPDEPAAFRRLPGVGRYTAGAVMSIAFGRREPIVDGNVRRVFARLWDHPEPGERELWAAASALIADCARPGDLNQALMELGATVCTPRAPRCGECPVRGSCAARAAGTQLRRPLPRPARPVPHEIHAVAVVTRREGVLVARRPARGRLGGLWEFPGVLIAPGEDAGRAAERALAEGIALKGEAGAPIGSVEHRFTHVRVTYQAVRCAAPSGDPLPLTYDAAAWVPLRDLDRYALPVAQRKIAALVLA
jgi:A/G-specific adenine glycosylase